MTLKPVLLVPLSLALGCIAAPREVETTLELGPQKVEVDVRLRDIRTSARHDLGQLRVFEEYAVWKPAWISDLPWASGPARFEYSSDGGQLDLAMHGSMSRADFDKCARAAFDAGVCDDFPLALGKAGYAIRPSVLARKGLILDPQAKTAWAADAGRMSYRFGIDKSEGGFLEDGPSLARGFELHHANPAAAAETIKKIEANEEVFSKHGVTDWVKELDALQTCTDQPWCSFRQQAAREDQLRLVHGYLLKKPEAGEALAPVPNYQLEIFGSSAGALAPTDALPLVENLRLRVAYDIQLDAWARDGWIPSDPNPWSRACRVETMKKQSFKDFCARLGVRSGPGKK